ncbi:hydroxysteroid dehydrogenase-like protein 2 [Biomphalaria pfeifferi]|uniref:Hydroxysteroid dehydrogenase-like protein 2 n=1 Tax=Biomphalaria pfeifferi TaxID=112525 RepID=A0AAD8AS50_BIOPF|nr:hydroxysteroid dehydrogenase-like protein 2 [Biomphalaria pfeifferi]
MKSALVIGATRGIGKQIALKFAENGYKVCVAAKTTEHSDKLPGTIYDVANEIKDKGGDAKPVKCNVRKEDDIASTVQQCINTYGSLDVAVYNAGAVLWNSVIETPLKRWDLMNEVNARGAFCMVQNILPHMLERKKGRLILVAPPIYNRFFKGKTPYSMTKVAMTVLVHGLANELTGTGVSISALWPATVIESHVTQVRNLAPAYMRKPTIFADACFQIAEETTEKLNGLALIDEDYLRSEGVTDFTKYRCDPQQEPDRMMPIKFPTLLVQEEMNDPPVTSKL